MGKRVSEPADIEGLFGRPGRGWTPAERVRVKEWLYTAQPLEYLLLFAIHRLGPEAMVQDSEDAWGDFSVKRLDAVINLFDPAKGRRFWNYLLLCFERFCSDKREGIHERRRHMRPPGRAGDEGDSGEWPLEQQGPSLEDGVMGEEIRQAIWKCVRRLPAPYRAVIVMFYFQEMSVKEIAGSLAISEPNVRIRLHRGRPGLADCIRQEGLA